MRLGGAQDNNRALIKRRKSLCQALLFKHYLAPTTELELEDAEVIELVIAEICQPQDGKLAPFAPVLVNMLRQMAEQDARRK